VQGAARGSRVAEREAGESLASSFAPSVAPGSQPDAVAAWEVAGLKQDSYRCGPGAAVSVHQRWRGQSALSLPWCHLFSPCGRTPNSKVHFYPLFWSLEPGTAAST